MEMLANKFHLPKEAFATRDVPTAAFKPETRVPQEAFNTAKERNKRGEFPAYVIIDYNKNTDKKYARIVLLRSVANKSFRNALKERYEIIQGRAPHKDWFRISTTPYKGNKIQSGGLMFYTSFLDVSGLENNTRFPMELVRKEDGVYLKLPPELVPLLK